MIRFIIGIIAAAAVAFVCHYFNADKFLSGWFSCTAFLFVRFYYSSIKAVVTNEDVQSDYWRPKTRDLSQYPIPKDKPDADKITDNEIGK